tara:strand:- start:341 stop:466 length:126 start_codon:yes stop_codon:yes gene_type:complete
MYVKKIANIFGVLEKIKKIEERIDKLENCCTQPKSQAQNKK